MIQLKRNKDGDYELSDKRALVVLSKGTVRIGEYVFDSIGEYETENIALIFAENGCLINWNQLQIVYQFKNSPPTVFEKDQFSSSNILLIDHAISVVEKDVFEQLMGAYDPDQVVISNNTSVEATSKEALQIEEVATLKLQLSSTTKEGRDFYKLA